MATTNLMELVYADGKPFVPELPNGKPRCRGRAKSRGGAQCEWATVPGATVCRFHGGSAPHVKEAAAIRLLDLVNPAIGTLARAMVQAPLYSDQIKAANSLLDRAGVVRQSDVSVEAARALMVKKAWEIVSQREEPKEISQ